MKREKKTLLRILIAALLFGVSVIVFHLTPLKKFENALSPIAFSD